MNYIAQINAFQECILEYELGPQEISLWYALMAVCNRTGWKEEFNASKKKLALMSGLSESSVIRARKRLGDAGLITFEIRAGRQSAAYRMTDISGAMRGQESWGEPEDAAVQGAGEEDAVGVSKMETAHFACQCDAQNEEARHFACHTDTQSETILKHKQYSLSTHTEIEQKFVEFWDAYPVHASERNAREAYAYVVGKKAVPEPDLLVAAENYARHCRLAGVRDRYIKHAANWLREEVYADYLPGNWKENIVEYKKPAPANKSGSGGGFSCGSRDYDFEELERRLLAGGK